MESGHDAFELLNSVQSCIPRHRCHSVKIDDVVAPPIPPFSCICTLRYYADKSLLNPPKIRLF